MATERVSQQTASQTPEGPVLCTNSCGFFGSQGTMGLCSKCYRETVVQAKSSSAAVAQAASASASSAPVSLVPQQQQQEEKAELQNSLLLPQSIEQQQNEVVVVPQAAEPSTSTTFKAEQPPRQPAPNRCGSCRKRVGLTGFQCRCGNLFCALHRYSDKHSCTYDYKAAGQEAIAKANPLVVAEKVVKF